MSALLRQSSKASARIAAPDCYGRSRAVQGDPLTRVGVARSRAADLEEGMAGAKASADIAPARAEATKFFDENIAACAKRRSDKCVRSRQQDVWSCRVLSVSSSIACAVCAVS